MDLTSQFAGVLVELKYSYRTVKSYRNIINEFLHTTGCFAQSDFTVEIAETYLRQKFESRRVLQTAFKKVVGKVGLNKPVTLFALRHSFAVHLLEQGTDIKIIQNMLGHKSASITNKYKSVAEINMAKVISPFELLNFGRE